MPDSAPPPADHDAPDVDSRPTRSGGPPSDGPHLATVSFMGHFWDVYVEMVDDPRRTDRIAGRLCFSSADSQRTDPVRTAPILIEPSYQEVLHRARSFEEHQLVGLLRSCLPEDEAVGGEPEPEPPEETEDGLFASTDDDSGTSD